MIAAKKILALEKWVTTEKYSIQILNQNIIKINYKLIPIMSYFYISPLYNFQTYFYPMPIQNQCQIVYNTIPIAQNISWQKNQQLKLPINSQEELNSFREQPDQPLRTESSGDEIGQNKIKIKKRRGIDKQKEFQSAKKNSQSNIINQFFSFFACRSQSETVVIKAILVSVSNIEELQKIISIFYNIMKCMSLQRIKKYVNKRTLLNIFTKENIEKQIPQILQKFKSLTFIAIQEINQVIRRCCFYFLRNISLISILASKRISALSKRQHLKKRRQLGGIVSEKL